MRVFMEKDVVCRDFEDCWDTIADSIKTDYPFEDAQGFRTSHLSVSHVPNDHKIWVFYYDNDGKHESDSIDPVTKERVLIIKDDRNTKRATLRPPNALEVEDTIMAALEANPDIVVVRR